MADVGIKVSMESNIPEVARQSSDALRGISEVAEDMKKAMNLGNLEQQYRAFAERVDRIYDTQRASKEQQQRTRETAQGGGISEQLYQVGGLGTTAGRVVGRVGGGDIAGGGVDIMSKVGQMAKGIPLAGGIAAAAIAALVGLAVVGNALASQYEEVMNSMIGLTASMGRFGETAEETSANFARTMQEVADSAAEFGMTLEEGTAAYRALITAGGAGPEVGRGAADVMKYARGYGIGTEALSAYMGQALRFNQAGGGQFGVLGMAAGGLQQSGMPRGMFEEFLRGTMDIFEQGLSRGIIKGFEEINVMQTWIAQLGDAFKGQYGVQLYKQMETAVVGATALTGEKDVLLYRAAFRRMKEEVGEGGAFTYQDVMRRMEDEGMSPGMFKSLQTLIKEITAGNEADAVEMMRAALGVSYSTATKLVRAQSGEEAIKALPAGFGTMAETPEIRLLSAQNKIMEDIREAGAQLLPIKTAVYEGAESIVDTLKKIFGVGGEGADYQKELEVRAEMKRELAPSTTMLMMPAGGRGALAMWPKLEQFQNVIIEAARTRGVGATSADQLMDLFANLDPETRAKMMEEGTLAKVLTRTAWRARTEEGAKVAPIELQDVLNELIIAIRDLDKSAKEERNVEINQYGGAGGMAPAAAEMVEQYKRAYGIE